MTYHKRKLIPTLVLASLLQTGFLLPSIVHAAVTDAPSQAADGVLPPAKEKPGEVQPEAASTSKEQPQANPKTAPEAAAAPTDTQAAPQTAVAPLQPAGDSDNNEDVPTDADSTLQPAAKVDPATGLPIPAILSHYTQTDPASLRPFLTWNKVVGAVYYDLTITLPNNTQMPTQRAYVEGLNVILPPGTQGNIRWTVQGVDLDDNPVSAPSKTEVSFVNPKEEPDLTPVPLTRFNTGNGTTLLYPVYNWIPVDGAAHYQIEVLKTNKVSPTLPALDKQLLERGRSTGFDWYDDSSHYAPYTMYWRVRAMDDNDKPLGPFTDPLPLRTNPNDNWEIGTLGDSISHGGGDLSYSPSDWEYSYQYYLDFDSINLSESGDTSAATLDRFDKDVLPFHVKYLIIMTGSNSLRGWVSGNSVISDLDALRQKCADNGIVPIFMTLPPINPANIKQAFDEPTADNWQSQFKLVNDWIRSQPYHIDLSGVIDENQELPTSLAADGLHLNFRGKQLMAQAINSQWPGIMAALQQNHN